MHYDNLPWYHRLRDAWRVLVCRRYIVFCFGLDKQEAHSLTVRCKVGESAFAIDKLRQGLDEVAGMDSAIGQAKQLIN